MKSKVREMVDRLMAQKDMPDNLKQMSLRVDVVTYYRLHEIADTLGVSKTSAAQDLLSAAAIDAWDELGLGELDADKVIDFARELEDHGAKERQARDLVGRKLVGSEAA